MTESQKDTQTSIQQLAAKLAPYSTMVLLCECRAPYSHCNSSSYRKRLTPVLSCDDSMVWLCSFLFVKHYVVLPNQREKMPIWNERRQTSWWRASRVSRDVQKKAHQTEVVTSHSSVVASISVVHNLFNRSQRSQPFWNRQNHGVWFDNAHCPGRQVPRWMEKFARTHVHGASISAAVSCC